MTMQDSLLLSFQTMKIYEKIRAIRQSKALTQDFVADKLNIDPVNYGRIERGQANLTMDRFLDICKILEIHPKLFFEESTDNVDLKNLIENIYQEIKQINEKLNNKIV